MTDIVPTELVTPRGRPAILYTREGTGDLSLAGAFFHLWGKIDDEYHLGETHVSGVVVDVGAHIGLVTVSILLDNPDATAICVEPLNENVELIARNVEANGLIDRVQIVQGAIGKGPKVTIPYGISPDEELYGERFIGGLQVAKATNTASVTVPAYTLRWLVKMAGGEIELLKIDCEGCEWQALAEPAVKKVRTIVGEWHGHPLGVSPDGFGVLRKVLDKSHDIEVLGDQGGTGTFRAVRR